ncbi:MAG: selenite/tellurite reduction operon b-type cytochrome membrane protein ExtQ [Thermodesulfobacteriota bacterium]
MSGYVNSSPKFFRLVRRSMAAFAAFALLLAAFVRAPLQEAADPGRVPNPVKSAWFLLWIQELVSYTNLLVYPAFLLLIAFLLLPRIPCGAFPENAEWSLRAQRPVKFFVLAAFLLIVILTAVAAFFRGENWEFVLPI